MASTLLLDRSAWDLCIDVSGNIAVASEPYALAQDVASACRLVLGELYFDTSKGIPYFAEILGKRPPLALIKRRLVDAALTVSGVVSAKAYIAKLAARSIGGQIQFSTSSGMTAVAAF